MSYRQPYDYGHFQQKNKTEQEITLDPKFDTEEVSKSGHNLYKRRRLFEKNHKVGTTYEDSKIYDARFIERKVFTIKNLDDTNNLLYKILACIDPEDWHTICAETPITPADKKAFEFDDGSWAFYKVQCKSSASTVGLAVYVGGQK